MPFLYHARSPDMRGDVLYPLNLLRSTHPDLYEQERDKYVGREALLELRIPVLGVLWNDAVHLSPVHPRHLAAAWRAAGLSSPVWEREFFRIPIERIGGLPCAWFATGALAINDSAAKDAQPSLPLDEVTRLDPIAYRELAEPPATYHQHLACRRRRGRRPRRSRTSRTSSWPRPSTWRAWRSCEPARSTCLPNAARLSSRPKPEAEQDPGDLEW